MHPTAAASGIAPVPAQPAMDNDALSQSIANQLRALIENRMVTGNQGLQMQQPSVALSDILSPNSLGPLFEPSNANVLTPLQDYLPADLPSDPSSSPEETLRRVIQSGPFQSAVRQLDRAFTTGLLGQLMPGFGLSEEAGLNVDLFLQAIYDKAKREHEESTRE
jgi:26S proteasome regulatory subunit N13